MDTHNIDICPIERYDWCIEKRARYKPNLWRGNARFKPYARYYPPLPYILKPDHVLTTNDFCFICVLYILAMNWPYAQTRIASLLRHNHIPADTRRNNNAIITSKRRRNVVLTIKNTIASCAHWDGDIVLA